MRILLDFSDYRCGNMGDLAMLKVAVQRLTNLWPGATIQVPVFTPDLLAAHCPEVEPIAYEARLLWLKDRYLFGRLNNSPGFISKRLEGLSRQLRLKCPSLLGSLINFKIRLRGHDNTAFNAFLDAILRADLVAVCGQGGLTDTFPKDSFALLDFLEMAIALGKPTVMFGQGIGPMTDEDLVARAKLVLPAVSLIALREARFGAPLLASLGVSPDRVVTTGDDAIELAYSLRKQWSGNGIGVNLRVARHSGVHLDTIDKLRPVLHQCASKHQTKLLPLPIARHADFRDQKTIRLLFSGYDDASDGGIDLDSPHKVIEQVSRCRVVVTGAYHASVFALSQGIPVVAIGKTAYSMNKFKGLSDLFPGGCELVYLESENLPETLASAIDKAWRTAEQVRLGLLESAKRQIEGGQAAYRRAYRLLAAETVAA